MTTKKTHIVLTTGKKTDGDSKLKQQLESRAARFGIVEGSTAATTNKVIDPAEADRLAKRAERFADIQKSSPATKSTPAIAGSTTQEAERLAKRAARFADIPKDTK